ncbi:MAG: HAD-IC family P-type ATPase [Solirubrobacterales bacterium]
MVQPLALLLWACAGLALLADESELTIAIAGVIVINAIFSFTDEYKADRAVAALQDMLPVEVHVRRDGEPAAVATEEVVPGDVLLLEPGDSVAADADLLSATDLRVDESALTGESRPVTPDKRVSAGTCVTGGSGRLSSRLPAWRRGSVTSPPSRSARARSGVRSSSSASSRRKRSASDSMSRNRVLGLSERG